jgi:hypothetical protein
MTVVIWQDGCKTPILVVNTALSQLCQYSSAERCSVTSTAGIIHNVFFRTLCFERQSGGASDSGVEVLSAAELGAA